MTVNLNESALTVEQSATQYYDRDINTSPPQKKNKQKSWLYAPQQD